MAEGFRDFLEHRFEAWGRIVVAHPRSVAVLSLVVAFGCAAGLPWLRFDVTFESFLGRSDPVLVAYEDFRDQFGSDERIIIAVEPGLTAGPHGVFDLNFLERLRTFHEAVEERVPYLDEVTSLVNARNTHGEGDTLVVDDFLEPWPEDAEAVAHKRTSALANPLFRNNVISADGAIATVVLEIQLHSSIGAESDTLNGFENAETADDEPPPLLSGTETGELVAAVHEVVEAFRGPDFVLHVAGSTMMLQDIATSMRHDMPRFIALAIAAIALFLALLFRRVVAVVIPLAVVLLSVAGTLGVMGWLGQTMHVPTQILPSFLLAVGVGDSVHLLAIFFARLREGDDRHEALVYALGHSGLALVLTSVTTAGGLASFSTSGLAPVAAIGIFAPFGVMLALGLSLTLLPALLCLVRIAPLTPRPSTPPPDALETSAATRSVEARGPLDRLLETLGRFATRRPGLVVAVSLVVAFASLLGASRLTLSHDPLSWLDEEVEIVRSTHYIDEHLGGSVSFEVLLDTDRVGGVRDPGTLERMALLGRELEEQPRDGLVAAQTISLADVVKEIHRALNEDRPEAYAIPSDPLLLAQELLLFENTGSDDLEDVTDSQFRKARMAVRMPWRDAVHYTTFFDEAEADVQAALAGDGRPSTTGVLALLVRTISAVVESIAVSYLIAFALISPLMILLLGSLRTGLVAMVPNLMPILMTLGLMGICGFPLDAFSLLTGGIAIGLAVDDTIHFMHNYRRYRSQGFDLETAVARTLLTTGRAMLITTIVLSIGFFGFVLSSMGNLRNFGLLVSFAITTALLADVLLAPALLALFDRRGEFSKRPVA